MNTIDDESRFFYDLLSMLETHLGRECELVLHTFSSDDGMPPMIADIRNGHVTGRKAGTQAEYDMAIASGALRPEENFNDYSVTDDGRILRSSSIYFHDETGRTIAGLGINQDITRAVAAEEYLRDYNMYRIVDSGIITTDINAVLEDLIQEGLAYVGKPISEMKRCDKIKLVKYLDSKGVFLVLKANSKVCSLLNISKFTLYNYLGHDLTGGVK